MAFYQRATKFALCAPRGAATVLAASSTSSLFGSVGIRSCITTTATSSTGTVYLNLLNRMAGQKLNESIAKRTPTFAKTTFQSRDVATVGYQQRKFATWSSSSSSSGTRGKKKGFVEWYESHLKSRPVITKAITGSILWGVGDAVAQLVPPYFSYEKEQAGHTTVNDNDATTTSYASTADIATKREFEYDVARTARTVVFGFAIHAPLSHVHFNFLEWMTVRGGFQGLSIPVFKTIMEQFVYWSWISNSLYHGAMGAMQGMNATQIYDRIASVLWDTQVAQWAFWIPVQLLNFQFVPVRHQLNVVLLTSVAWTALLSAWYPPEEDKAEEEGKNTMDK